MFTEAESFTFNFRGQKKYGTKKGPTEAGDKKTAKAVKMME